MSSLLSFLRRHRVLLGFVALVAFGLFLRFWNYHYSAYFIYDQGRDAVALSKIMSGKPVLVGPTSGIQGFYLGPLWFYLGLPGFVLSGGNPYLICLWYMGIGALAIPLYWVLSRHWFKSRFFATLVAYLLVILPGSISAAVRIWNPLISVPLMAAALICFWQSLVKSREDSATANATGRKWLLAGFLALAFTLQSEFAYAVFYLLPCFLLIPWFRNTRNLKKLLVDFVAVIAVVGVTGIPQLLFEVRYKFSMLRALLTSFSDKSQSVSWAILWERRPDQLMEITRDMFLGGASPAMFFTKVLFLLMIIGIGNIIWQTWQQQKQRSTHPASSQLLLWQLTAIFGVIPYFFFMFWRGNYGNFFDYYLTCHFVFMVPLLVKGLQTVFIKLLKIGRQKNLPIVTATGLSLVFFTIVTMTGAAAVHWNNVIAHPENRAGLHNMLRATSQVFEWAKNDGMTNDSAQNQRVIQIYTANIYTEQYDYLFTWFAKSRKLPNFRTVRTDDEKTWYILVEAKYGAPEVFFKPWYQKATAGGHLVRQEEIGIFTIETWKKNN